MKYYRIWHSANEKEIGKYPQVKAGVGNYHVDDEKYIGNRNFYLKKIEFTPSIPDLILWKNAKVTDLLSYIGLSGGMVISDRLKGIFENHETKDVQYFKIHVSKNDIPLDGYWYMRYFAESNELIDFVKSDIWEVEHLKNTVKRDISSFGQFMEVFKSLIYPRFLQIVNIELKENINDDYFVLGFINGGTGLFVSEKLKAEIEDAGCTGLLFAELNEKYPHNK